ncbi:MAG: hypothetical protein J7623_09310 [Chitinophaga sp.]|uniref:hypothetical protein n=1 Tax=Chitinophaga sp. TaxID=1869181 RepID=UPI001B175FB3|nr:hypothetical protein [Chitinophaga sp.]MBO9728821.1 hypothetical protein [Chitinophaga sp.]
MKKSSTVGKVELKIEEEKSEHGKDEAANCSPPDKSLDSEEEITDMKSDNLDIEALQSRYWAGLGLDSIPGEEDVTDRSE